MARFFSVPSLWHNWIWCCICHTQYSCFQLVYINTFYSILKSSTLISLIGKLPETYDDAVSEFRAPSSLSSSNDVKSVQHEIVNTELSSSISNGSTIKSGVLDTMSLLRILGEGYRHLCGYRCQVLLLSIEKGSSIIQNSELECVFFWTEYFFYDVPGSFKCLSKALIKAVQYRLGSFPGDWVVPWAVCFLNL